MIIIIFTLHLYITHKLYTIIYWHCNQKFTVWRENMICTSAGLMIVECSVTRHA